MRRLRGPHMFSLALLSAAMMALEIALTRVFAIAQFYHFAFVVIGLTLLGLGASGTWLAASSSWRRVAPGLWLWGCSVAFAVTSGVAFLAWNALSFDPFVVAWDRRQWLVLALHIALWTLSFFWVGLAVAASLEHAGEQAGMVYGVNLAGTALGALLALTLPRVVRTEGVVAAAVALAGLAAGVAGTTTHTTQHRARTLVVSGATLLLGAWLALSPPPVWQVRLSPYKALMQVLRFPNSRVVWRAENAFSRIELVESPSIRHLPGLSIYYAGDIPQQRGIFWDGDNPSAVVKAPDDFAAAEYLPLAAAFVLKERPRVAVLSARGGLDVVAARALGAREIWAVVPNPLVVQAAADVYRLPGVATVLDGERPFLQRPGPDFDIIVFSLSQGYRPVRSGAYSLVEDYRYTVEAVSAALARLRPGGVLVITRWLQVPPSEWVRAFALATEAVARAGGDPASQIAAFRGYNTGTLLVKATPFTAEEVSALREFLAARGWDLVWAPGMRADWANRYNILPEPVYYLTFRELLTAEDRSAWYSTYPFDVRPPTDDHPFFEHYFRWQQLPDVWATLGKTWEPFGGAGYLVILAMLAVVLVIAGLLIGFPLVRSAPQTGTPPWPRRYPLLYFAAIGLGYLCVEIPLIQMAMLPLVHATYAFAAVVLVLLFFGAVGSMRFGRGRPGWAPLLVAGFAMGSAVVWPSVTAKVIWWPLATRAAALALLLAPLAVAMGTPFPRGLFLVASKARGWTPWAWAVNGGISVVASPLAALIALTWGFRTVLAVGVAAYVAAWLIARGWEKRDGDRIPRRGP